MKYILISNVFLSIIAAQISGKIIDGESNKPVKDVDVYTDKSGTTSTINGTFFIDAIEGSEITFSHVGYTTLTLKSKNNMEVILIKKIIQVEEIVVNGGLEKEYLKNTASSVKVIDKNIIRNNRGNHFQDIMGKVANLNFAGGTSRPRYFQIRGIGERSQYFGEGPPNFSVGFILDDIDLAGLGMAGFIFDLDQVEVFKGPQSAIYGTNAIAGLINLKSTDPKENFQSSLRIVSGLNDLRRINGMVNFPLSETVDTRVSFELGSDNGFRENKFLNKDNSNIRKEHLIRSKLRISPNKNSSTTLTLLRAVLNNNYDMWAPDNNTKFLTFTDRQGMDSQETIAFSLKTNYKTDIWNAEFIFSESNNDLIHSYDGDWGNNQYWMQEPYSFNPEITGWEYDFFDSTARKRDSQTIEGRLDFGSFLLGIYSNSMKEEDDAIGYLYGGDASLASSSFDFDRLAIYGQFKFSISQRLKVIGNLRQEKSKISYYGNASYYDWNTYGYLPLYDEESDSIPSLSADHSGGRLTIQFFINEKTRIFGSISKGYKAGGINQHPLISSINRKYNPESMVNREITIRRFTENSNFDITLFQADRSEQQVSISSQQREGDPNSFKYYTANATNGYLSGVEIDATYKFNSELSISGALGILRTHVNKFIFNSGIGVSTILGDREAAHAPSYSYNFNLDYAKQKGLFGGIEVSGKDEFYFSDSHDQMSSAFDLVNMQIGYKIGAVSLSIWGRNILDKRYAVRGFYFGLEPIWNEQNKEHEYPQREYMSYGDPLNYGISLDYTFD